MSNHPFSAEDRRLLTSRQREWLCFCFVLSCACVSVNTQGKNTESLGCERCQFFIWTSCLSTCHADVAGLVHLQNLMNSRVTKWKTLAAHCLPQMERLKPIQTKFPLFSSELVDGETTRGEQLAQLCHQITLSLISVSGSAALLSLPSLIFPNLCFE